MHVHAAVSTVFFISLSILLIPGPRGRAAADSVCVEQPDRAVRPGEHWYYHFDREKNRKCWHRGPAASPVRDMPSLFRGERQHSVGATINSVFGPLVHGIKKLFREPMPHQASAGEPRIVQSDATKPLTIEDIAQQPEFPEERAERPATPMTPAQRKLFEEFLKWQELQRAGDNNGAAAQPPAAAP